jgi:hypothetical protein
MLVIDAILAWIVRWLLDKAADWILNRVGFAAQ